MRRLLGALAVVAFAVVARNREAQPGCESTKAILCDGKFVCTTDTGNSCVTCPRPM